jgi:class 3 adenylate cyclase
MRNSARNAPPHSVGKPPLAPMLRRHPSRAVQFASDAKPRDASAALDGERKTVTALFADIKGSMELMEDLFFPD